MAHTLTKLQKVNAEQTRISQLTNQHSAHFKVIFSHQLETNYDFDHLHRQRQNHSLSDQDIIGIFKAFGKFFDNSLRLSITDVESKYKRQSDPRDGTYDPETKSKVQIEHFCLYVTGDPPNGPSDSVRLHGYYTRGGYFVVTRLDWYHGVHG